MRYKKKHSVRILIVLASIFYLFSLYIAYREYIFPTWEYFGFSYRPWELKDLCFALGLTVLSSMVIPAQIKKPSSFIIISLYLIVYIPSIVSTLSQATQRIEIYGLNLLSLNIGFMFICAMTNKQSTFKIKKFRLSWAKMTSVITVLWLISVLSLVYSYSSIMRFVGLDEIYSQRFAGSEISSSYLNYVKSLFINVICAFCMAYGLVAKKALWFFAGTAGCLVVYMISAAKFVIAIPVLFIMMNILLTNKHINKNTNLLLIFAFGFLVVFLNETYKVSTISETLSSLFTFRTLAIPGLFFSQYHDLFSAEGFTWWSHVKIFSAFIPAPENYVNDPKWPSLGLLVGSRIYGYDSLNANANLWSGDGIAAAGAFGVLVISAVLSLWLKFLDAVTKNWNINIVILSLIPYSIGLTNSHFFTTLTSFGGLAWFLGFALIKTGEDWPVVFKSTNIK